MIVGRAGIKAAALFGLQVLEVYSIDSQNTPLGVGDRSPRCRHSFSMPALCLDALLKRCCVQQIPSAPGPITPLFGLLLDAAVGDPRAQGGAKLPRIVREGDATGSRLHRCEDVFALLMRLLRQAKAATIRLYHFSFFFLCFVKKWSWCSGPRDYLALLFSLKPRPPRRLLNRTYQWARRFADAILTSKQQHPHAVKECMVVVGTLVPIERPRGMINAQHVVTSTSTAGIFVYQVVASPCIRSGGSFVSLRRRRNTQPFQASGFFFA